MVTKTVAKSSNYMIITLSMNALKISREKQRLAEWIKNKRKKKTIPREIKNKRKKKTIPRDLLSARNTVYTHILR
jgi:hypothetical protein